MVGVKSKTTVINYFVAKKEEGNMVRMGVGNSKKIEKKEI